MPETSGLVYLAPEDFLQGASRMQRALRHADRNGVASTITFLQTVIAQWQDSEERASRAGDEVGRLRAMMVLEVLGELLFAAQGRLRAHG